MKTKSPRILILGGGYAGLLCAARLARSSRRLDITLVDARDQFEQRIRYHEALAGRQPKTLDYAKLLNRRGVHFSQGQVERLDTAVQTVTIRQAKKCLHLHYDYLVLTLGSQVEAPVPGVDVHAWRPMSLRSATAIYPELGSLARRQGHLAVVGGGLTALEIVTELKERFPSLSVSLISRSPLSSGWSRSGYRHLREALDRLDIRVLENRTINRVKAGALICDNGEPLLMDRCIWAAGFQPSPLAVTAGLPTGEDGRVLTDENLRVVGHDRLFVAGDMGRIQAGRNDWLRMGCVTAMPQGAQAGDNLRRLLNGQSMEPFRFGYFFRCVSLGRGEGLIQYVDRDDRPTERINRGRLAVWIKEGICLMTYASLKWELKTGWPLYQWPRVKSQRNKDTRATQPPRASESTQ